MSLPLGTSYEPMNALLVDDLPKAGQWQYEPKWDGFRCLAFKDAGQVQLMSKNGQHLTRYFPEIERAIESIKADRFVLDGEIVIPSGSTLSFDKLLQRIHPAESRVRKLSAQTPGLFIVFDLLAENGKSLVEQPLAKRRERLEVFAKKNFKGNHTLHLSPATTKYSIAKQWFTMVGGALDGIIAKHLEMPYQSGNRHGMVKVKKMRTADCVVGGFRYAENSKIVGSLLLGLYDDEGLLDHVGFCSSFTAHDRKALLKDLKPLIKPPGFSGKKPGGPSRWSGKRSTEWEPLQNKLVVEVRYDHFTGGRFRHGTKFLRWRPDKSPRQCTMKQVKQETQVSMLKLK